LIGSYSSRIAICAYPTCIWCPHWRGLRQNIAIRLSV